MSDSSVRGVVFDIQRYSIHDGPGIRTTVFLKGCPLECSWCQNPESQSVAPQILLYHDRCTKCARCIEICPTGAVYLSGKSVEIDRKKCIACGKCLAACPNEARKLAGTYMTIEDIMREVRKDARFYNNTGGGITLSGGEPLFQIDFAITLLEQCKQEGLHTTIETTGQASWSTIERALKYVDLVFQDIKHVDEGKHISGTGVSNRIILENARKIAHTKPTRVRVPLIPGFNDSVEDITAIARFVKAELGVASLDLLAYNKMGESKYKLLDRVASEKAMQEEAHIQTLRDAVSRVIG